MGIVLAAGAIACSRPEGEPTGEPLFDAGVTPEVLIEESRLAAPPAVTGNRFVSGWWPWRNEGEVVLSALPRGGRLELVALERR